MNNNAYPHELELPPERPERQFIALLTTVYLEAGLPLEFAVKSAIADYELFDTELLSAS